MSHVVAGGRLPGPGPLLALFAALTVTGAVVCGGRWRRFEVTTMMLGGMQLALHLFLHHLSMPHGGGHPMPASHSGHSAAGHMPDAHMTAGHEAAPAMTAGTVSSHALATLGTALCVIYGERVLTRLAALVVPRICRHPAVTSPVVPRPHATPPAVVHAAFGVLLARCRPRRGPPMACPA
ncbi:MULTISPECIES: hypothetical protein [unclassified Streptomyces]|uniref:hypothetical protein n=1 Tax=unclassified Streptomyces TaxID=2593676 RepID=UPI002DDBF370|nr:hypothetical protein [Streptomyces sp. NBC_01750]WSA98627.1 hypothetical protein OIE54_04785 [Streptomyces sp. NBC_01794]WSD36811.1 hypothetical protein OG966_35835 [Streptomyces sp. NBC_01750]